MEVCANKTGDAKLINVTIKFDWLLGVYIKYF